jgi:hypothetical protein
MCLYPDDPDDPWVFRVEIPEYGKHYRVVFTRPEGGEMRLLMEVLSFRKRPDVRNPRPWVTGALAVGAAALAGRHLRARRQARIRSTGRFS